ncbi:hypothetical protein V1511DRAFT_504393 [Dipodascopsis uninucleata]
MLKSFMNRRLVWSNAANWLLSLRSVGTHEVNALNRFQFKSARGISNEMSSRSKVLRNNIFKYRNSLGKSPFFRRFNSTGSSSSPKSDPSASRTGSEATGSSKSSGGYFSNLTKKYGWPVVYVYLGLSALDYPFCFAFVHYIGQEKVGQLEHMAMEYAKPVLDYVNQLLVSIGLKSQGSYGTSIDHEPNQTPDKSSESTSKTGTPSLLTEMAIAYGVHKSLVFIRLPLAVAITPSILKFCEKYFPRLFKTGPKFGVKPDAKRKIGGSIF